MPRDPEERLIAFVMLVVAGLAAVAWYAWVFAGSQSPDALELFVLGSVALTIVSISAGPIAFLVNDRRSRAGTEGRDPAMIARQVTLLLVVGTVLGTVAMLIGGPSDALVTIGTALGLLAFWVVLPLSIAAVSSTTGGTSLLSAVVAWPGTNLLALLIFAAPTPSGGIDFGQYTVTVLDEPARTGALLAIAVVVAFGPTLLGKAVDRLVYRSPAAA